MIIEVEFGEDILEVELEGSCRWENDSIGWYEWWGQKCFDKQDDYPVCEDVSWDKRDYSPNENDAIEKYVDKNFDWISERMCREFEDQCEY